MRDALKSYFALASGLAELPRQRALAAAKALVAQGEATAEQVQSLAEDLLQQSKSNRDAVSALVKHEVDRTLARVGLASQDDVVELTARIRALEAQLREQTASAAAPTAGPTAGPAAAPAAGPTAAPTASRKPGKKAPGTASAAR